MSTLSSLAEVLRNRASTLDVPQAALREKAGIAKQTMTNVMSGREDYKVSTLLAVAGRLGLELVLVPKDASPGLLAAQVKAPAVKSRVAAALEALETKKNDKRSP
ncbi:hypothetical protein CEY04_23955 [Achromobacter sp. HZ28]|nr:hypothetical protein CEY05_25120 [Achromobacter sp. HZ34]OWT73130.1 hypothetical protein CEY04_23955 [Achromobacter sp. HZ28]